MKGGIYTKEKCPICGSRFKRVGEELICEAHQTRPHKVFIQLYSRQLKKAKGVYSIRGVPFTSATQAYRILTKIRAEIDAGQFDITRYVAKKLKPLRFENWSQGWFKKKETEVVKGLISPSYLRVLWLYVRKHNEYFKDTDIRDVGNKQVHEYYLSLSGSPHYIKNIIDSLRNMLKDAFEWEDINHVPKFPAITVPDPDTQIIDIDMQDKIISSIPDPMDRAFILLTAREMIRPSETRAL